MSSTPTTGELRVSSKVLGHISEGLYRGPAGVFKELISNAFDANAKTMWISTGRPTFDVVSVRDDGDGMTLGKFKEVVSGGIGDSDKRILGEPLINGRQVIGRLGIGILGVSQISHEFSIVSHSRPTQSAFRALVQMKDFRKEILDNETGSDYQQSQGEVSESKGFTVGSYEAEAIDFDPNKAGLMITATEPTEGFRRQLSEDQPLPIPKEFSAFIEWSRGKDTLATGPWYRRMIWQIASLAPIPYLPRGTDFSQDDAMFNVAGSLEEFDFNVIVDGVKLYKPFLVTGPATPVREGTIGEGMNPFHFPLELNEKVWGSKLVVRGYLYSSAGSALHPSELRGVLIRLRHVGVGEYDKSFLGYRFAEGPRFAWLTGELFVDEGLEDALTVGRDGFDAGHPHYIVMRKWLHDQLRSRVFPTLYRGIDARRISKEHGRNRSRTDSFIDLISSFAGVSIEVRETNRPGSSPVEIDLRDGVATVNTAAIWPRGKRQREMAQRLSIIFELVRLTKTDRDAVSNFVELTQRLLSQQ